MTDIETIPHNVAVRADAARSRALRNIDAEDAVRAQREAEALDQLRRQVIDATNTLNQRRAELETRRVYLANVKAELEDLEHRLQLPTRPGTGLVVVPKISVHDVEHSRAAVVYKGEIVCTPTVYIAGLRAKDQRHITCITTEAMAHLIETGAVQPAEVSP